MSLKVVNVFTQVVVTATNFHKLLRFFNITLRKTGQLLSATGTAMYRQTLFLDKHGKTSAREY